jgi:hypothetical protein
LELLGGDEFIALGVERAQCGDLLAHCGR